MNLALKKLFHTYVTLITYQAIQIVSREMQSELFLLLFQELYNEFHSELDPKSRSNIKNSLHLRDPDFPSRLQRCHT